MLELRIRCVVFCVLLNRPCMRASVQYTQRNMRSVASTSVVFFVLLNQVLGHIRLITCMVTKKWIRRPRGPLFLFCCCAPTGVALFAVVFLHACLAIPDSIMHSQFLFHQSLPSTSQIKLWHHRSSFGSNKWNHWSSFDRSSVSV